MEFTVGVGEEVGFVWVRPRQGEVGLHGSGAWAQKPRPHTLVGEGIWACDSRLGYHAPTGSRLVSSALLDLVQR
jgi:hypothetical protein